MEQTTLIVIGEINTDIVVTGLKNFPTKGGLVNGNQLFIGPGGKSRNIANMAGLLMPKNSVAMIARTIKDEYGLWQTPITALEASGVNTEFINVLEQNENKMPGFALILVDEEGSNEIIGAPGISAEFCSDDIDNAQELFKAVGKNNGLLAFTSTCPTGTALHASKLAKSLGIKVLFDPGGTEEFDTIKTLLPYTYVFKPNEHEASMITGIKVHDHDSAGKAAQKLMELGATNVMITVGARGAYLFSGGNQIHIEVPDVKISKTKDETGCGDQSMAALCASLQNGQSLEEAARRAVLAGALQFYKHGIQPITKHELEDAVNYIESHAVHG